MVITIRIDENNWNESTYRNVEWELGMCLVKINDRTPKQTSFPTWSIEREGSKWGVSYQVGRLARMRAGVIQRKEGPYTVIVLPSGKLLVIR